MTSAHAVYSILSTLKDMESIPNPYSERDKGIPNGIVYAALMTQGISFASYQGIIANLITAKLVQLVANQLYLTDKGRELAKLMDKEVKPD